MSSKKPRLLATMLGLLAIVFWSTVIGVSRHLTEQAGMFTSAAITYSLAGGIGCIYLLLTGKGRLVWTMPKNYLWGCGAMMVIYTVCLYLALGMASSRQQAIEVGVINYLWPGLTLALSLPILHRKASILLLPGIAVAFGGVVLAGVGSGGVSWNGWHANLLPYASALTAAVIWGMYSNFSRRWAAASQGDAVPLFLLACGAAMWLLRLVHHEQTVITGQTVAELAYVAVFPTLLAYVFWDLAMRKGNLSLVVSASYLTPLLSTVISGLYLGVQLAWQVWLACVMVIVGAVICKLSIREDKLA